MSQRMTVTFDCIGLTFEADCHFTGYTPAYISGPPELCSPAEGGYAEIDTLTCDGKDAMFLLGGNLREDLEEAAYQACEAQIAYDNEAADEARAEARHLDREYA